MILSWYVILYIRDSVNKKKKRKFCQSIVFSCSFSKEINRYGSFDVLRDGQLRCLYLPLRPDYFLNAESLYFHSTDYLFDSSSLKQTNLASLRTFSENAFFRIHKTFSKF